MVTRQVGGYNLAEFQGVWFLTLGDRTVSTLIDMDNGTWRARTPEGGARTIPIPDGIEDPARYVAEQIT